jgi:hypothetical protein
MQFTHLAKPSPTFKPGNLGITNNNLGISKANLGAQAHMPVPSKIVTLPAKGTTTINPINGGNNNGNPGKVTTLPTKVNVNPANRSNNGTVGKVTTLPEESRRCLARSTPILPVPAKTAALWVRSDGTRQDQRQSDTSPEQASHHDCAA